MELGQLDFFPVGLAGILLSSGSLGWVVLGKRATFFCKIFSESDSGVTRRVTGGGDNKSQSGLLHDRVYADTVNGRPLFEPRKLGLIPGLEAFKRAMAA